MAKASSRLPLPPFHIHRRRFLGTAAAAAGLALPALGPVLAQETTADQAADQTGGETFSFDVLSERMRALAADPYQPPEPVEGFLADLTYDAYQRIRFNGDRARWADTGAPFRLQTFHPGWLFNEPVKVHEIVDGQVRDMTFTTDDFEYDDEELAASVPENTEMPGIAGFRLHTPLNRADIFDDLVVFQGASYFRALGRGTAYGLSARGLALNTGLPEGEEFPRFSHFWLERPAEGQQSVTLYAALDSPSVTGAYRFVITPGKDTRMEVTARVYLREDVSEVGIAPLTSMYLFSGADRGGFDDYRAAVHDSEALVVNLASGDTVFRALNNPPRLGNSYIGAQAPKSFGLVQRSRDFEDYLDAQAHYGERPSLMVEPLGDWGPGAVRLVEIPSDLEINDNIVAFWVPEGERRAGDALELSYNLYWGLNPPGAAPANLARVVRTRVGEGGVAGVETKADTRKFVVDFAGGVLSGLPRDAEIEPVVSAAGGEVVEAILSPVDGKDIWRLVIEVRAKRDAVVELKAAIEGYDRRLTETWAYQWIDA